MKKVLIVDDALFMRKTLSDIVYEQGYEVVAEAIDGDSAVNLYFQLKPDIVLMDVVMPNKNGIDAAMEILEKDKDAKIIIVSALGQQGLIIDALKGGVKDYIIKPFTKEKVVAALKKL